MFKKNKVSSYVLYALGEILLVMVGILLALQVNNWNERRKLKANVDNTLRTISSDLATDTLFANRIISFYEKNLKNSQRILNREITKDNYKECMECIGLVTIYQPFTVQSKGFESLKTIITGEMTSQKDSLLTDISQFYSIFLPLIDKSNVRMENEIMDNFNDLEKRPWFVDLSQGKISEEMILYFTESDDYRNRVAAHNILAAGNHLGTTKQYKANAVEIIRRITARLEKDK